MITRKKIFFIAAILFANLVMAQSNASIKASVNKNRILLGEPLVLTIETYLPSASKLKFEQPDTIAHFEFLEIPVIDVVSKSGGQLLTGKYSLTSFDSGHWVIPSFQLSKGVKTDTIPIDVVFSDFNSNQDYHDIKDIIEVKAKSKNVPWWIYGMIILLLAIIFFFYKQKKKVPIPELTKSINDDPYKEAMDRLAILKEENPEPRIYYSGLTSIFRVYIFRKKGILSLQKTTDDLILQVKDVVNDKEQFDKLSQALRLSDFVKFAKYIPSETDNEECFQAIKNTIIKIEKTEIKVFS